MKLRMTLERPVTGYWDGGPRSVFDFAIDGPPRTDSRGAYIRVGSWSANHWFHVALGKTARATLAHARRRLSLRAKRAGERCQFTYIDEAPNAFEHQAFGISD